MRILLICPPIWNIFGHCMSTSPPLGLMYLAAILEQQGHRVKVIDADTEALKLNWEQLAQRIKIENPDIVGLTATSLGMPALFKTAELIKKVNSKIFVVVGGYGPTLEPERTFREGRGVDAIMLGEGEKTIVELVEALHKDEPLDKVKGIIFRQDGGLKRTEAQSEVEDLDSIPMPAYQLLEPHYSTYGGVHGDFVKLPNAVMLASRGCPHRCIFCSNKMVKVRFRSPKNICDEIEYLRDKLGFKSVQLYDNEFVGMTANQNKWVSDVCEEIISRGLDKMEFMAQGRCSHFISLEVLKKMKRAGFRWVWWGVESGSPKVLEAIKKDLKIEDVITTFSLAKQAGLKSMAFIMIGLPKETREDVALTAKLLEEIKPDITRIHITTPLPGSELYEEFAREGKIDDFDLINYDTRRHVIHHTDELSAKEIKELYQMMVFRFEHNKFYFIKVLLKSIFSLEGIAKLPRRLKKIASYSFKWIKLEK